jgi:UbiD family decarboxylase
MAMLTALGTELYTKQVIVVDDDVDIFDMEDVMWAVATRVKAEKDIVLIPGVKSAIIDPTSDPVAFTVTKMGIDATAPIDETFAERLVISEEQRSRAQKILANAGVS